MFRFFRRKPPSPAEPRCFGDEPGKVGIYRYGQGKGGDFDAAALEALIAAYYEENF